MVYGDDGDNNGESLILLFALLRGYIAFLLFETFEENEMLRWFRRRLFFVYNYILSPHLTQCYGLLRTVLFKLYFFRPYHFSFVVCPSVLDDLPLLVAVASSSSFLDLLRIFNYIIRVSKIAAYLLREEVHVDFSGSNVDDCFNNAEERSPKDDGWIILVFAHVNNLKVCMDIMIVYFDRTSVTIPSTFRNV